MKFELDAKDTRARVREEFSELMHGSSVVMKRKDYYTFRNAAEFDFVFLTGLEFRGMMLPRSSVAYFQPAIAICHKELSRKFRKLQDKAFSNENRRKERWEPPNFLHLYALRGRKEVMYGELEPLIGAAKDEFRGFLADIGHFESVSDPKTLLHFLDKVKGLYGPTGLALQIVLQKYVLSKVEYHREFGERELPPYHRALYQSVLKDDENLSWFVG